LRVRAPNRHGRARPGARLVIAPPCFGAGPSRKRVARRRPPSLGARRRLRLRSFLSRRSPRPVARSGLGVPLADARAHDDGLRDRPQRPLRHLIAPALGGHAPEVALEARGGAHYQVPGGCVAQVGVGVGHPRGAKASSPAFLVKISSPSWKVSSPSTT
jgi:hypothetical protein